MDEPYSLKLASADSAGNILIWDVYKSSVQTEFRDGTKSIAGLVTELSSSPRNVEFSRLDMMWYSSDTSLQFLLVVHTPNIVTLWNTQSGAKIWRIVYDYERQREPETFLQIIQDPFNHQRAICKQLCW